MLGAARSSKITPRQHLSARAVALGGHGKRRACSIFFCGGGMFEARQPHGTTRARLVPLLPVILPLLTVIFERPQTTCVLAEAAGAAAPMQPPHWQDARSEHPPLRKPVRPHVSDHGW